MLIMLTRDPHTIGILAPGESWGGFTPTKTQLAEIFRLHVKEPNGLRANLRESRLRGADLSKVDLHGADLYGIDLSESDLSESDLSESDLFGSDLREAILRGADLRESDMSGADLTGANLDGAILDGSTLGGARLPDGRAYADWQADPLAGLCDDPDSVQRARDAWGGRAWPLHAANGWKSILDAPVDRRCLAATFLALYGGGHLG